MELRLAMPLSACAGTPDVIYYPEPPLVVRDGENDSLIFSLDCLISLEILCQCEIEVRYVSSDWAHFRSPKNPDSAASSSSYPTFLNDLWVPVDW